MAMKSFQASSFEHLHPSSPAAAERQTRSDIGSRSATQSEADSVRLGVTRPHAVLPLDVGRSVVAGVVTDLMFAYSTLPHHVSWRTSEGIWFVSISLDVLQQHGDTMHAVVMLMATNKRIMGIPKVNENRPIDLWQSFEFVMRGLSAETYRRRAVGGG